MQHAAVVAKWEVLDEVVVMDLSGEQGAVGQEGASDLNDEFLKRSSAPLSLAGASCGAQCEFGILS